MITRLLAADRVAVPWKNGGGVTREVCVFPAGAGMDDFLWRISMAEVAEAGPFSLFEGIDRHLTVLRGRLHLSFDDREVVLGPGDSLGFDGGARCHGTPLDGPVTDLNVMTRRGQVEARVRRVEGDTVAMARAAVLIDLTSLDAVMFDPAPGHVQAPGTSILVEFA